MTDYTYRIPSSVSADLLDDKQFNALSNSFRAGRLPHDDVSTLANIKEVKEAEAARVQAELMATQQAKIVELETKIATLTKETT